MRAAFVTSWNEERQTNRKLGFYNTLKSNFSAETYLDLQLSGQEVKRLAQFRMSAHKFNIETGRYLINRYNPLSRICQHCSSSDIEPVRLMAELPMFEPIVEDENHVLTTCSLYDDLRLNLSHRVKNLISAEAFSELFKEVQTIRETARFLIKVTNRRFPMASEEKKKRERQRTSAPDHYD